MSELDSNWHLVSLLDECRGYLTNAEATWRMQRLLDECKWYVLETTAKLNHWVKSTDFFFSVDCRASKKFSISICTWVSTLLVSYIRFSWLENCKKFNLIIFRGIIGIISAIDLKRLHSLLSEINRTYSWQHDDWH